jgi:hypothetical protein
VRSRRHRRQGQTRWRTGRGREGCVRRSAGNSGLSEAWQHARAQGAAKPRAIRARGASRHGPERFIWRARSAETAREQKALWLRVSQESGVGPRARFRQELTGDSCCSGVEVGQERERSRRREIESRQAGQRWARGVRAGRANGGTTDERQEQEGSPRSVLLAVVRQGCEGAGQNTYRFAEEGRRGKVRGGREGPASRARVVDAAGGRGGAAQAIADHLQE